MTTSVDYRKKMSKASSSFAGSKGTRSNSHTYGKGGGSKGSRSDGIGSDKSGMMKKKMNGVVMTSSMMKSGKGGGTLSYRYMSKKMHSRSMKMKMASNDYSSSSKHAKHERLEKKKEKGYY
jgi:hypothetical protein